MAEVFDGFVTDFVIEARERCDRLEELLLSALDGHPSGRNQLLEDARRELHTLKGNAGMVGLRDLQTAAHALEDKVNDLDVEGPGLHSLLHELDDYRTLLDACITSAAEATPERAAHSLRSVRVPFSALDELVDLLAEMVVFRNRLDDAITRGSRNGGDESWRDVTDAHDALAKTLALLQDHIMAMRMVPLGMLFSQLRRIVHDEAAAAGKEARLVVSGGDTPMDKALLESASESLGHLVRNAVTHGIEKPAVRGAAGKRREGTVHISATTQSEEVWIEVVDDGGGIDSQQVIRAAQDKGLSLQDLHEPLRVLFNSGFSTKSDSDISAGRGMGLSAALEAVRRAGGDIDIESEIGRGTRFRIRIPLTLSITRAMLVRVDADEYAVPLSAIIESIRIGAGDVHIVNDAAVLNWRGRIVPLLDLGLVMASAGALHPRRYVVIIDADGRTRGLLVDELIGMREIVVKGLGDIGAPPPGISGATILGDGRVLLIADPKSLVGLSPLLHTQTIATTGADR
ncbi:MAG TPA: chemotaxis protein CheW [Thermoanaerobaculia bacterium]|nr:chemotaxis protein CheW [Thermoanaerobaculia bacterium]